MSETSILCKLFQIFVETNFINLKRNLSMAIYHASGWCYYFYNNHNGDLQNRRNTPQYCDGPPFWKMPTGTTGKNVRTGPSKTRWPFIWRHCGRLVSLLSFLDRLLDLQKKYVGFWFFFTLLVEFHRGNEWHSKSWIDGTSPKSTFSCNAPGNARGKLLWTRRIINLPLCAGTCAQAQLWAYSHVVS